MPAAAVIPAPEAYINVVAVKTLVVGSWGWVGLCPPEGEYGLSLLVFGNRIWWPLVGFAIWWRATEAEAGCRRLAGGESCLSHRGAVVLCLIYFEKNRVLKADLRVIE